MTCFTVGSHLMPYSNMGLFRLGRSARSCVHLRSHRLRGIGHEASEIHTIEQILANEKVNI